MNYQETVNYLFEQLPMFSKIGAAAYKEDLTNTILLCKALGNPQHQFKAIHIAGTNGKGSTSHMIAAIMQTAGYKTGLYTSPHLKDFRERIKINGKVCDEQFVIDFTKKIQPHIHTIQPSFFEITVAMAFYFFAQQKVDIAIIETGLGGRLDSTNIIIPILSIITNIGFDHMNILGNTLPKIATEKAGIIKQNIPVVIGEKNSETTDVFLQASKKNNSLIFFAEDYYIIQQLQYTHHLLQLSIKNNWNNSIYNFQLDLTGIYQSKNICTVLQAIYQLQLQGYEISLQQIQYALQHTKTINGLQGRWEILHEQPTIIADVAHNADGIQQLLHQLHFTTYQHLHIVLGVVKDKDINAVLSLLPKQATYYFTKAQIPRALQQEQLQNAALQYGLRGNTFNNVNDAIANAKQNASTYDLILVCGSVFLVGEIELPIL